MSQPIDPKDQAEYNKLFQDVGFLIRNHLAIKDKSQRPVLRVLHVLATHAAVVIVGTNNPKSLEIFSQALNRSIIKIRKDFIATQLTEENKEQGESTDH